MGSQPHIMTTLSIASLNVNGLKAAHKQRGIFDRLRRGEFDICLLQESHSTKSNGRQNIWKAEWGGPIFFSHGTSNSRGVCTLISRNFQHAVNQVVTDEEGRFLVMDITTDQKTYVVGNAYAPTADSPDEQDSFMDQLEKTINDFNPINIIIGGDLNTALDPKLDRQSTTLLTSYGETSRRRVGTNHYVLKMIDILKALSSKLPLQDPVANWEWIKYTIRKETSPYEKQLKAEFRKEEKKLNTLLADLTSKKDREESVSEEEIASIKRELSEMELSRAQGIILRAKVNWSRYGEKPSRYFLNLEKRKSKDKTVTSLITEDYVELTDIKEILEYERTYFEKVYIQTPESQEIPFDPPFAHCPTIPDFKKQQLEQDLTTQELQNALKLMS